MMQIKRWYFILLMVLAFMTGIVVNAAFAKIGWDCNINSTSGIETCTRGVLF